MDDNYELLPGGFRLVQDQTGFKLGTDSILLANFPSISNNEKICDLGCGSGAIGLILAARNDTVQIDGLEIQELLAKLARQNAALNNIQSRMKIFEGDLCRVMDYLPVGRYDLVVCNPPYFQNCSGHPAAGKSRRSARSEILCTIQDVCRAAAKLTRWGGKFAVVYRVERLVDLILAMRRAGLEPKRMRMVQNRDAAPPHLVLVEARRGGKPGLTPEPPLILHNNDGTMTDEAISIYRGRISNNV